MTGADALHRRSAAALAAALANGALTALDLAAHYTDRILRLNPVLNAFTAMNPRVQEEAAASDERRRIGQSLGPLDGMPVVVKDNLWVRDMPATWGSRLFENFVPAEDEITVAALRHAGAVFLGKTNCPEFAMRGVTANPLHGATGNPWNVALTPGGSSGGAAAAVAAGLAPLALATDGGGSIRRPAAHTGLVGFKPTIGRVPRGRGFPETMHDCEVIGPIARDVAGARLLFDAIAMPPSTQRRLRSLRILYVEDMDGAPVAPEILESSRASAKLAASLGHAVSMGPLPFDIAPALGAWAALGRIGLARLAAAQPCFFDHAAPDFVEQAGEGAALERDEAGYIRALEELRAAVISVFHHVDILMTPAIAAQPWPKAELYPPVIAEQPVGPRGHAIFTAWVNCAGLPAIALPSAPADDGMPIGVQLVGAQGSDDWLMGLGAQLEAASPFTGRWPERFA